MRSRNICWSSHQERRKCPPRARRWSPSSCEKSHSKSSCADLREDDPPKLSTKIRAQDVATTTELARNRQTEPPALVKQMRGELDPIALKALEKDRSRRYGSPSDFAADIGRYLKNEPVLAVPASAAYRARKFARRYRVALVTVVVWSAVPTRNWASARTQDDLAASESPSLPRVDVPVRH